jgi:hypothetical protein
MVLDVVVEGAPAPETSWWKDDVEIKSDDLVKAVHTPNFAKIMFIPAKRTLRGKYVLKAMNQHGKDTAEVEINVFGKPTVPRGPLEVTDVTKKTCHLTWKMPEDDGGHKLETYEVEKHDANLDQWLPAGKTKGTSIDLRNLSEGKAYKFLVRAVNKEGDSPDLISEEAVVAKDPFDPPSPPTKVTVSDWGVDFAQIKWHEPDEDGGAEITSYRVEMRNRDKRGWNKVATIKGGEDEALEANITEGIETGREYEFRVIGVNKAGDSENSKTSNAIVAKARFVKPKIERDMLPGEKEMFAGQTLKMSVTVTAEPPANVSFWSPSGAMLENTDAVCVKEEDGVTTLTIAEVSSDDTGIYKVKAKNSQGVDEVEVRVNVIGPPDKPKGPLEISDVNRGVIHQLLSIILKLRILVLLPVLTLPYVVTIKNCSQIGE